MADDIDNNETVGETLAAAIEQHEAGSDAAPAHESRSSSEPTEHARQSRDTTDSSTRSHDRRSTSDSSVSEKVQAATSRSQDQRPASEKGEAEIPETWSAKDKAAFGKLAPEAREFVLRQHQEHSDFRREYDPVHKIFEPYRDRMKTGGWTPHKLVEAWANVENRLMSGDAVNVIAGLVKGYKVDMGQVAQALGLSPRPQQAGGQADLGRLPPQVAQQLKSITDRLDAGDRSRFDEMRRRHSAEAERVMGEIAKFKATAPHFDEVEQAMTEAAHAAIAARKPVPSLKELYDTAVWSNPKLREAALAERDRARQSKPAGNARPAATQVRRGNGAALSLREELEAALGG